MKKKLKAVDLVVITENRIPEVKVARVLIY